MAFLDSEAAAKAFSAFDDLVGHVSAKYEPVSASDLLLPSEHEFVQNHLEAVAV